jgi:hypothetical protein
MLTNISEKLDAFIFRLEFKNKATGSSETVLNV